MQLKSQTEIFPAQPISTRLARGACPSRRERTVPQLCWGELFLVTGSIVCCRTWGWSSLPASLQRAERGFWEGLSLDAVGRTQLGTAITLVLPCSSSSATSPHLTTDSTSSSTWLQGTEAIQDFWKGVPLPLMLRGSAQVHPIPPAQTHTQAHAGCNDGKVRIREEAEN